MDEIVCLSVLLDSKLYWKWNLQEILKRGLNSYCTCRNFIDWKWEHKLKDWVYISNVHPVLIYRCSVWWQALDRKCNRHLLAKTQRLRNYYCQEMNPSTGPRCYSIPLTHKVLCFTDRNLSELGIRCSNKMGHSNIIDKFNLGTTGFKSDYVIS